MKVLHVINSLSAGGAELHLLTLCRHLRRQRVEMVVACLREQFKGSRSLRPDFEQEGIRIVHLRADSRYAWRFLGQLARLLKEEQPDILHTHLPRADLAGAWGHWLCPSNAWVCSVHGIYSTHWSGRWSLPLFDSIWRRADAVVAISHAAQDWLVRERHLPPEKVIVIPYGIEAERFIRPDSDLRKIWGLNGRAVVGSIGRLEPIKGYDCSIQAMPAILERVPNTSMLIAGHDPWGYGKKLQALIEALGFQEQVRLVGFQSDVPSFLHALDVFAFPSRSEGFGQVLVEAMAAGRSVVASKIPPLTEIVEDGETGLLVEPDNVRGFADAIVWLLTHPEEAQRMGRRGQELVRKRFCAERMSAETLSLYQSLTGEAR